MKILTFRNFDAANPDHIPLVINNGVLQVSPDFINDVKNNEPDREAFVQTIFLAPNDKDAVAAYRKLRVNLL